MKKKIYEAPEELSPDMDAEVVFVPPDGTPFWKKLVSYFGIWLIIIAVACIFLWSVLSQYEASLPQTAIEEYLQSSRQEMFFLSISKMLGDVDNKFENAYDVSSKLSKEYSGTLTYTKLSAEYTHENPVYIIKHNGENLFKVTLEAGSETGFMKFKNYNMKSIELVKADVFTFSSYKRVFAANMLVHINNVSLGTDLTDFEKVDIFGADDYYGIIVKNFAYEPEIVALSYIYEEEPDRVISAKRVGDCYILERAGEEMHTLTITAPSEAVVAIDGKAVASIFATEQYVTDDGLSMTVYTVPTVFNAEKLTVTLNGKPLEVKQDGLTFTTSIADAECVAVIANGAALMKNGEEIDASYITNSTAMWHSDFDEIKNYPTAVEYTVKAAASSLSATLDGKELTAYTDGDRIVFTDGASDSLKDEYSKNATDFVYQYLYYSTQGYRDTDTNLANTLKLVAPSSPLYSYLRLANVGIEYKSPQNMTVEYLTADNFIPYGDDAFVCDVSYKAVLKNSVSEVVEENVIHLIFIKSGGKFLPAKFIL